jgi:hypothetical protein
MVGGKLGPEGPLYVYNGLKQGGGGGGGGGFFIALSGNTVGSGYTVSSSFARLIQAIG